MKDRVREAVFNLLGEAVRGAAVYDWFAGTGALGLEAISRGARSALFVEKHVPTAEIVRDNIRQLELDQATARVIAGDSFFIAEHDVFPLAERAIHFLSPPYDFLVERRDEMLQLIQRCWRGSPAGSLLVVEADERFATGCLPAELCWIVRPYPPAVVAVGEVPDDSPAAGFTPAGANGV